MTNRNHPENQIDIARELLSPYLDGEVTPTERSLVEQTLADEPSLQAEFEALQNTVSLLSGLPPQPSPRPFTLSAADVGLEVDTKPKNAWWMAWFKPAIGAVAALMAVFVVAAMLNFNFMPNADIQSQSASDAGFERAEAIAEAPMPAQEAAPAAEEANLYQADTGQADIADINEEATADDAADNAVSGDSSAPELAAGTGTGTDTRADMDTAVGEAELSIEAEAAADSTETVIVIEETAEDAATEADVATESEIAAIAPAPSSARPLPPPNASSTDGSVATDASQDGAVPAESSPQEAIPATENTALTEVETLPAEPIQAKEEDPLADGMAADDEVGPEEGASAEDESITEEAKVVLESTAQVEEKASEAEATVEVHSPTVIDTGPDVANDTADSTAKPDEETEQSSPAMETTETTDIAPNQTQRFNFNALLMLLGLLAIGVGIGWLYWRQRGNVGQ